MNELDLHGIRHKEAKLRVEEFFAFNRTPFRIITGNSPTMKRFVQEEAKKHDLKVDVESDWNLGSLIIHE